MLPFIPEGLPQNLRSTYQALAMETPATAEIIGKKYAEIESIKGGKEVEDIDENFAHLVVGKLKALERLGYASHDVQRGESAIWILIRDKKEETQMQNVNYPKAKILVCLDHLAEKAGDDGIKLSDLLQKAAEDNEVRKAYNRRTDFEERRVHCLEVLVGAIGKEFQSIVFTQDGDDEYIFAARFKKNGSFLTAKKPYSLNRNVIDYTDDEPPAPVGAKATQNIPSDGDIKIAYNTVIESFGLDVDITSGQISQGIIMLLFGDSGYQFATAGDNMAMALGRAVGRGVYSGNGVDNGFLPIYKIGKRLYRRGYRPEETEEEVTDDVAQSVSELEAEIRQALLIDAYVIGYEAMRVVFMVGNFVCETGIIEIPAGYHICSNLLQATLQNEQVEAIFKSAVCLKLYKNGAEDTVIPLNRDYVIARTDAITEGSFRFTALMSNVVSVDIVYSQGVFRGKDMTASVNIPLAEEGLRVVTKLFREELGINEQMDLPNVRAILINMQDGTQLPLETLGDLRVQS